MLMTWRNTNEIWESVYVKEAVSVDGYALATFEQSHRGPFAYGSLAQSGTSGTPGALPSVQT